MALRISRSSWLLITTLVIDALLVALFLLMWRRRSAAIRETRGDEGLT